VFPVGTCRERERLLQKAMQLIKVHIQTVEEFSNQMGREDIILQEAALRRDEMKASFATAQAAWEACERHVKEHRC
jgi:hypothetical protein